MNRPDDHLRAITAHQLTGSTIQPPHEPLDGRAWRRLTRRVRSQRLAGLLHWAIIDRWFPATDDQASAAADEHDAAMALDLRLERRLVEFSGQLVDHDIDHRVLKGPAVAQLDYPDPSYRSWGDIDVLIRADDLARTGKLLAAEGADRAYPEPRSGYDRRFGKGMAYTLPDGTEVDVHRTLSPGPFGLAFDPVHLFESPTPFMLGGSRLLALGPAGRLHHACLHVVLGGPEPRWSALRDIAQLLDRPRTRQGDLCHLARRYGTSAVVAVAVVTCADQLGLPPSPTIDWARAYLPGRRDRRWLGVYQGTHRTGAGQALEGLTAVKGAGPRLAYAWAVLLPRRTREPESIPRRLYRGFRSWRHSRPS